MSLSAAALITVAEARVYADIVSKAKPTDEWLELTINGISAQVMQYTGAKYRPLSQSAETRDFQYQGGKLLGIDETEDVSLVEFSAQPGVADSWTELEDTDYALEPLSDSVKSYLRFLNDVDLPESLSGWSALESLHTGTQWPAQARQEAEKFLAVRVTAVWGVTDVPDHVKLACCLWIKQLLNRDYLLMSSDLAEATISRGPMPADVKAILDGISAAAGGVEAV